MGFAEVKMKILIGTLFTLALSSYDVVTANSAYTVDGFKALDHGRPRRDVPPSLPTANASALENATSVPALPDTNKTTAANATTLTPAVVTQTPLLGYNGTGQRRYNLSDTVPKVSDPIVPELDNISYVFKETPETIKAERNLANLTYDNHNFYNSSFIGNETYFDEYWKNITQPEYILHDVLSNSHRRATIIQLNFDFPFYGHMVRNVTVATGGFVYTGDHVHNWLAATQYIAPLMGNFDTSITNDSAVKLFDDGEKFTVLWEDVTLQEDVNKTFTFAATLYKNGDIIFAYKHIPIPVQSISDADHPVKVGISDAYLNDKILFYVRRKTIYEYHRVSFKNYEISNKTILKLTALPTCVQYTTCDSCVNHNTGFNCMWCPNINKCSSGTDRNKQDWILRSCEKNHLSNGSSCPAAANVDVNSDTSNTAYTTDTQGNNHHDAVVTTTNTEGVDKAKASAVGAVKSPSEPAHSPLGGVVAALLTVTLVCCLGAWLLYAFKNPHTRSGQLLIKYRPSQWSWRRGEARYTAATIHM